MLYSAYFSNTRGAHLIPLVCAHQQAQCFTNDKIHELIVSVIGESSEELYKELLMSLYPFDIQLVSIIRSVKAEEAEKNDSNYKLLSKIGTPYRFEYLDKTSFYGYKLPIPPHSDF